MKIDWSPSARASQEAAPGPLPDQVRLNLALAEEHKFGSGTVYLCYRPA